MNPRNTARVAAPLAIAMVLTLLWGCAPPPKPKEMVDFEALRASKEGQRLAGLEDEDVRNLLAESQQFYDIVLEKYDDEDLEDVKQFALLGTMKWRTAKALMDRDDARARMSEANDKYAKYQDVRNENNEKRTQVEKTIGILERQKTLLAEKANLQDARDLDKRKADQMAKDKDRELSAQKAIDSARVKRTEAEGIKADTYKESAGTYNRANNGLKAAERYMTDKDFLRAAQEAEEASRFFDKAIAEATPIHKAEQDTIARDESNKQLFAKAHSNFRDNVRIDGRGMVIVLPALFKTRKDKIDDSKMFMLDEIDKLAREFPDYKLLICGHTEKAGNASRNMTLSQARAQNVRDFFLQRGIPASRMQTAGYGNSQLAFENRGRERFKNNRVEIIFLYQ